MPVKITKVCTRTGDKGRTSLIGGKRVSKDHPRIEACGSIDELNSYTGMARAVLSRGKSKISKAHKKSMEKFLKQIQTDLMDLGCALAVPAEGKKKSVPEISSRVEFLDSRMNILQKDLKPLSRFVIPGDTPADSALHICRTVCRRAERDIVRLNRKEKIDQHILMYINRLSDMFFVMARHACTATSRQANRKKRR
jgi:cob(I)alamin adenosyltransferase